MKMSTFQLIVTGVFALCILLGVWVFATFNINNGSSAVGHVVIWGTADQTTMDTLLSQLRSQDQKSFQDVSYVAKDPSTYTNDLINAMASGSGPDLFLVSQDEVSHMSDKITVIPWSAVSQQSFTQSYVDEGQLFLTTTGAYALPFMLDPMVMYWNRDVLSSAGVASPPSTWSGFLDMAPRVTSLDGSNNITTSAVALGEWSNIQYAKDILAMLMLQAGDQIVTRDQSGALTTVLGQTPQGAQENPASSALQFYTEFANPSKTIYSWNGALPNSQDAFVAGNVGVYFGLASDDAVIAGRNPNLNFAVSLVPQLSGSTIHMTFGELTGVAISRTSPNQSGALTIAEKLTSQAAVSALATLSPLPPVRRDVSVDTSSNAAASVFAQSALISHAWLDPDPTTTDQLFETMIESVVSGSADPAGAIFSADQSLQALLHQ